MMMRMNKIVIVIMIMVVVIQVAAIIRVTVYHNVRSLTQLFPN